jgi:polyferredoxin
MERGVKLFPSRSSARHRRRRIAFLVVFVALTAALVWPVYPLFSGIRPLILGLPLSLAYIVIVLLLMFAAQIWLYLGEEERG